MLKKDVIEDDYSYISDSQLEQMEKLKPLIRGVLYKFTEYKDAPDSMNFFRADVYRYFFLLSFMCEYFENNEISQEHAISLVPQKFASRIKRLQVLKQAVKLGYILETSSSVDKRRRIYSPSSILVRDFIESYNQLSAIFSK
ncbi:MAG: hypothetical protein ACPHXQ_00680 [Gammaproteobacteria bacterium]|jgi:hypothetical protein|tara:strand:- start:480 stop:905 length:426 start_codon:yes stop_codon:yes gene_type:complete